VSGIFERLVERLRGNGEPSASELRQTIAAQSEEATETQREVQALEQKRPHLLVYGTEEELAAHDEKISAAYRRQSRNAARKDELARLLAEADAREQEGNRQQRYDAVKQQVAEASRALAERYPRAAAELLAVMRILAEANAARAAVNATLPAGAELLPDPEQVVRGLPGEKEEIVGEKVTEVWCYADAWSRGQVDDSHIPAIKSADGRTGILHLRDESPKAVVKRKKRRISYLQARGQFVAEPLTATLDLPALKAGEPPYFEPISILVGDGPRQALAQLDKLEAKRREPPRDPRMLRTAITRDEFVDENAARRGEDDVRPLNNGDAR
jgi:hypothetical protein